MDPEPLHTIVPARAEELADLRHVVVEYARMMGVDDPFGVALAVSETVSNAILHAYADEPDGGRVEILVESADAGASLRVTVVDHGCGMRPRDDSPGLGAGLPLISRVAKRFDISEPPGGGTKVCMVFAVGS